MPEGDTIYRAASRIAAVLVGHTPEQVLTPHPRHRFDRWPERLAGRSVESVDAYGKHLFVRFDGALTLHSHLRMSGAWGVYGEHETWRRARSRAWLVLRHAGHDVVQFDGPVLELTADRRLRNDPRLLALGQDVLGEQFDSRAFLVRLRSADQRRELGDALLDQRLLAGIGNVWKSECCFALALDPWQGLGAVSDERALALVEFAREHMRIAVRDGVRARPRAVYRRAGEPCPRCDTPIRSRGQGDASRTTFWCPGCQR